jgi:DNA modification methylase
VVALLILGFCFLKKYFMELKIKEEFKKLIPPLTPDEYKQLETNCIEEGIRDAIITWNGYIIDGHNRYKIAQDWSLLFKVESKEFKSEQDVKVWMILNQFGRRNIGNYTRAKLALELEDIFRQKAKENLKLSGENYGKGFQTSEKAIDLFDEEKPIKKIEIEKVNSVKEVAKVANLSHDTISKVKKIEEKAAPEIKEKLSTGELSINQAYQDIKKEEKKEELKEKIQSQRIETKISENIKNGNCLEILENLEDGCIDIVLTDPPYGINYISNRSIYDDSITKRGLMNDGNEAFEILDKTCQILSNKVAQNAHLYFFCSWSVYSKFESIISKYFTIKTPLVWDKGNKGSGDLENDWGNQTEIIIFCVKGKKLVNNRRGNLLSIPRLHSSKMVHPTQKPVELINEILEVSYTKGDFIVDPFMGSGSTIKACNKINAKSLGIEIDNEMFNIANKFINE